MQETISPPNFMIRVMNLRDFRLLFAGATTSLLGVVATRPQNLQRGLGAQCRK